MRYPLASSTWDSEEIAAIHRVIDSNIYTMGEHVRKFEAQFAEYVNSQYCVMVNSGSSANLLMIAAMFYRKENPLKRGDEVIVPAVSWATTYYPLYQYGLKLKFVDVDLETLNYDLSALEEAITDQTRLIMLVNLLGNPNDFNRIGKLIENRNIQVVEDNCESLGATFEDKHAGTFGLMGSYSAFFSHHISTMEGGMIVTNDEELYHLLLSLRAHGWTRQLPKENKVTGRKSDNDFDESFNFVLPGYNVRPVEMSGAIGIEQLKKLPLFIEERRKNAEFFVELFKDHPYFSIQKEIGKSSWFGFSLIVKPDAPFTRDAVVNKLQENNIDCRPIVAGNFAKNKVIEFFDYEIFGDLKNSNIIDASGFFVGNHQFDISNELNYLKGILDSFN